MVTYVEMIMSGLFNNTRKRGFFQAFNHRWNL